MAHDHVRPGPCLLCSVKHLGTAKVRMEEALASSDPERRKSRLLDVTFQLAEAETTHLAGKYPGYAQQVRNLRKKVEDYVFEYKAEPDFKPSDIDEIVSDLVRAQSAERKQESSPQVDNRERAKELHYASRGERVGPQDVLNAIGAYQKEYETPASTSDIQFALTIPHDSGLGKEVDEALAHLPEKDIAANIEQLEAEGLVEMSSRGGFYLTPKGMERDPPISKYFNTPEGTRSSRLQQTTKEAGVILGSSFIARGTERLTAIADQTFGLTAQPPYLRAGVLVPILGGIAAILAALKMKEFQRRPSAQLGAIAFGSHLLTTSVDVAEQMATTGTVGLAVVGQAYRQPILAPHTETGPFS